MALNILVLLGLCWSLAVASPLPTANGRVAEVENGTKPDSDVPEHCLDTWSFDAATMDHNGTMLFFKGEFVWRGHSGTRELISARWKNPITSVDAAFRG
ncbi:hypothetical protein H4997_10340, partial [Campylobacter jejuni]|nr:hypothetical protein [Campylobacter jejuni]